MENNEGSAIQMSEKRKRIAALFAVFFKIGAFTFGGGYAMIPLIQREVVENKKWITDEDILEIVAIAESTPGPIAINSATFVGYKVAGFFGAMFATLGVVLPSFVIISAIAGVLELFEDAKVVQYAFNGIRAGVLALIIKALINMYKKCPKSPVSYAIMIGAFIAAAFLKINVFVVVVCCAIVGLIASLMAERRMRG
jgi:chromate transporter